MVSQRLYILIDKCNKATAMLQRLTILYMSATSMLQKLHIVNYKCNEALHS